MNLTELATFVCDKVRKPDADSLAACKGFLKRRDEMLWNGHLWRDSIYEFTKSLDPTASYTVLSSGTIQASLLANKGIYLLPRCIDRVLALRNADRSLPVEHVETYFRTNLDAFAQEGEPLEFNLLSPACWQNDSAQSISYRCTAAADNGVQMQVRYVDQFNEVQNATLSLTTTAQSLTYLLEILEVSKPVTENVCVLVNDDQALNAVLLAAASTYSEPMQRIRLLPLPEEAFTLRALVKLKYQPMVGDYDKPRLRQSDNVLIAYSMGDMLQRRQQFGKARECFAEGAALLEELVSLEVDQQARNERLVPDVEPWHDEGSRTGRLKAYN